MAVICPTVTAMDAVEYSEQMYRVAPLASRIQIDLMDEKFAGSKSQVTLDDVWWPTGIEADIHLMYADPFESLEKLILLKPSLAIIHVETMVHHMHFAAELHKEGIKAGLAVLQATPISNIEQILHSFDHLLLFSGNLGHFGGDADLQIAEKAKQAKLHHPELEIGWDGGINDQNVRYLAGHGIDVLNVGGFIHKAQDPQESFRILQDILV